MNERKRKNIRLAVNLAVWLVVLVLAGVIGKQVYSLAASYFLKGTGSETDQKEEVEVVVDAKVEPISCNLLLSVMPGDGSIQSVLLEILNVDTHNLDYVSIPLGLTGDVPVKIEKALERRELNVPREISLAELSKYFQNEALYQYYCVAVEEWTKCPVTCYTAVDYEYFQQMYEIGAPTQYLEDRITAITSRDQAEQFFKLYYNNSESNLSFERKMYYASAWAQTNAAFCYVHNLPTEGTKERSYVAEDGAMMLRQLLDNESYSVTQEKYREMLNLDDQDVVIRILNSTSVNGLAARFRKTLEADGYYVLDVGNYEDGIINQTRIQVTEEGAGIGLVRYFDHPSYEVVKELPSSIDVLIILGSSDGDN